MSAILFVDMLGSRRRWQTGGVPAATEAFGKFAKLVISVAREHAPGHVKGGGIETDSAMLIFDDVSAAVRVGRALYLRAFGGALHVTAPRLWLRGCITPGDDQASVRHEARIREPLNCLSINTYSHVALEAISVEKSGYRGMRLLVQKDLITREVSSDLRLSFGTHSMLTFTTLQYSGYPSGRTEGFSDFLWMATKDEDEWFHLNLQMMSRLRYSAPDPEELAQAAATQVVFHEVAAIRQSVVGRVKRAKQKQDGQP